jgi:single-strand DNA-binding protein
MSADTADHRNEVLLVGRLSAAPEVRVLPSGDEITTWRLVVARDDVAEGRAAQDTIDCTAWSSRTRRSASSWAPGDVVEVEGALRRRFWKTPAALASRCEVEVSRVRRVAKAPAGITGRRTP